MKKLKGFTLAETLVTLSVIGVIAVLTVATFGNKIDRNKAMFKKAYSITERTVVELVNDETLYPYDHDNFGFKETTDVPIPGADPVYYTSTENPQSPQRTKQSDPDNDADVKKRRLLKFCNLFSNNLSTESFIDSKGTKRTDVCRFVTTDGIYWYITNATSPAHPINGFVITIDTDGTDSGVNRPPLTGTITTNTDYQTNDKSNVKNRDKFYIYVRYDGKIQLHDYDITAQKYVRATNFNSEN